MSPGKLNSPILHANGEENNLTPDSEDGTGRNISVWNE